MRYLEEKQIFSSLVFQHPLSYTKDSFYGKAGLL